MDCQNPKRVVIIDENPNTARLYQSYLMKAGFQTILSQANSCFISEDPPDSIIVDADNGSIDNLNFVKNLNAMPTKIGIVVTTSNGSIQSAVDAIRAGGHDFIVKPLSAERLIASVNKAIDQVQIKSDLADIKNTSARKDFCGFIGGSPAMKQVYRLIEAAAPSTATVFITGESGTGKEVAAEAIHGLSERRRKPFVAINCGAIPVDLIESEMFGHLKGSFTGAATDRKGAVQQAEGGTLFLDEICEMHIDLQAKLLRFLQSGSYRPVGATRTEKVDVRVICATNRKPLEEVQAGRFREDLYYRLHVLPLALPPLREREGDVVQIAEHLLKSYAAQERKAFEGFDESALAALSQFQWPGNVRQLQNMLRNAVVNGHGPLMTSEMLPIKSVAPSQLALADDVRVIGAQRLVMTDLSDFGGSSNTDPGQWKSVHEIAPLFDVEQAAVARAVTLCDGNIPRAAAFLLISPSTVYRKLKSWNGLAVSSAIF